MDIGDYYRDPFPYSGLSTRPQQSGDVLPFTHLLPGVQNQLSWEHNTRLIIFLQSTLKPINP